MQLTNKNAIITGARTGIGFATLESFAKKQANVWAIVHTEDNDFISKISNLAADNNIWIKPIYVDLSCEKSISDGIKSIAKEKLPIDILVNAAGIVSHNRLIQMTPLQDMHHVMDVNFFATIQMAQLVSRIMCRQKSGSIINIASVAAWDVNLAQLEYVASKAAVVAATKKMAKEWGEYNVRVNAVAPGVTTTKMLDSMDEVMLQNLIQNSSLKRVGAPSDIAEVCAFLASDISRYITGQTIRVDGGM